MARKKCPIDRLSDAMTKQPACMDWCPFDSCVLDGNVAISYKVLGILLEIREKIVRSNKRYWKRKERERKCKVV